MKRTAQAVLFAALLAVVALGLPGEAQADAYNWSTVTVDSEGDVGTTPSIAVDANGDPMISYYDSTNDDLKFAICDLLGTNCDEQNDWTTVTVDSEGEVGAFTSIAVDANGDPMISYWDSTNEDLKFAICDLSASACDETTDWTTVTVDSEGDVGRATSIGLDANGDPAISYLDDTNFALKFAICDLSATGCDEQNEWTKATVDAEGGPSNWSSIAVDANGDPMISYHDGTNDELKFAICDRSASTNGNCDQTADWGTVTVEGEGETTSIAVDANGDPMISYRAGNFALKFATCDMSATGCDETAEWSTETVDAEWVGRKTTSIAVDADGDPVISYRDLANEDLKFATGSLPLPVGGIAELPDVSDSSAPNYIALAALAAAALLAFSAGAWYARRRFSRG